MIPALRSITLSEWETKGPDTDPELRFHLDRSPATSLSPERLRKSRFLEIVELRSGTQVRAFSHVGRVRVANLEITIEPKIKGQCLLNLLRYAYGFRKLELYPEANQEIALLAFQDLLIYQLLLEVEELLSRGLAKAYIRTVENLSSPRGRIDIQRLALSGGYLTARLPCRHFPRTEDTALNRVVLSGLGLAASMCASIDLQRKAQMLATLMHERVSSIRLAASVLDDADRRINRLSLNYAPSLAIVRMLFESRGTTLKGEPAKIALPGFLFDMNAFFQALVGRFLKENLSGCEVREELGLRHMIRYAPQFNPQHRRPPTPRPDIAVRRTDGAVTLLDAKYRDLWEKELPRDMLYQLVVYAISQKDVRQSSILYPAVDHQAKEARLNLSDPIFGTHLAQVCLRPIDLIKLSALLADATASGRRSREEYASHIAFGTAPAA